MRKFLATVGISSAAVGAVAVMTPSLVAFVAVTTAMALAASVAFSIR